MSKKNCLKRFEGLPSVFQKFDWNMNEKSSTSTRKVFRPQRLLHSF